MDKVTALFIRAIKSGESADFRVKRVYQRFYYHTESSKDLAQIISNIVSKYNIMQHKDYIDSFNPDNAWKFGINAEHDYHTKCLKIFKSFIRLTKISDLQGFPVPAKYRKA